MSLSEWPFFQEIKMCFTRTGFLTLLIFLVLSDVCLVGGLHAAQGKVQENRKRLIETNSCPGCDLTGADLKRANLPGANLQGANLSYAQLHLATLTRANLQNAVLINTELNGANLSDADLRGADLRGTNFTDAYIVGIKVDRKKNQNPAPDQAVAQSAPPVSPAVSPVAGNDEKSVPAESNGFLERTWGGMMGYIFGSDASEEQPTNTKKSDSSQKTESTPPVSPAVSPVTGNDEKSVPAERNDFLRKSWGGMMGYIFGPDAIEEQATNTKKSDSSQNAQSTPPVSPAVSPVTGNDEKSVPAETNGFLQKTWGGMMGYIFGPDASEKQPTDTQKSDSSQKPGNVTASNPDISKNTVVTGNSNAAVVAAMEQASPPPVKSPVVAEELVVETDEDDEVEEQTSKNTVVTGKSNAAVVAAMEQAPPTPVKSPVVPEELVVETDEDDEVEELTTVTPAAKKSVAEVKPSVAVAAPRAKAVVDSTTDIEKNKLRLLETKKCYGCNLAGVDLSGKNLSGADLEGANLAGSNLAEANLENANLKAAILVRADLRNAKLQNADFYKADLSRADLSGAKLEGALLEDAQVTDTMGYK
jgi:uncharacterized protein YjbI with pentapeptide repeats